MTEKPKRATIGAANPADSVLLSLARVLVGSVGATGPTAWPQLDLEDPHQREFGDYELLQEIGRGGMGIVYRARQRSLERDVAIKFIAEWFADTTGVARFLAEARAAARLMHPNIVPVHEVGSVDGLHYFSMPLIAGLVAGQSNSPQHTSLAHACRRRIVVEALRGDGLRAPAWSAAPRSQASERNARRAGNEPLITDFGLARHMDERGGVDAQEVSGTPSFMAPEQILIKQYRLTPSTDIYALGAILYRCLTVISTHGEGGPDETVRRAAAEVASAPPRQGQPRRFPPNSTRSAWGSVWNCSRASVTPALRNSLTICVVRATASPLVYAASAWSSARSAGCAANRNSRQLRHSRC